MDKSQLTTAALATLAAGGLAYALVYPYLSGEVRAEKRQRLAVKAEPGRDRTRNALDAAAGRREQVAKSLKDIEDREKKRLRVTLEQRIQQAGLTWSKQKFYLASLGLALALGVGLFVFTGEPLVGLGALFFGGLGVPRWVLSFLKKRRINKFLEEFANAMDVIVRGVKAGLPLGDCIRVIANEAAEPVRSEFRNIVETQALGVSLGEACAELYRRVPITEANFFGIVISIQQKAGGNLAETLANLSRVLRERKKMKGKIIAMSMEAKASAAIIAALPFIVALLTYLSSPDYILLLFITTMGKLVLCGAGFWMVLGILVIRKMVAFDF